MPITLSPGAAVLLLLAATSAAALIEGAALAQLMWENEFGSNAAKKWALWLGAISLLLVWAWLAGNAINTPGVHDNYGLAAVVLGAALFFSTFIPRRRALRGRTYE